MSDKIAECFDDFRTRLNYYHYKTDNLNYYWFTVFRKLTQAQKLWWHLKTYGKVTSAEVERIYLFCHPPSVIRDIRKKLIQEGSDYQIDNITKEGFDIWGNACKYDEYTLREA